MPEVAVEEDKELEARLKRQRREEEEKSGKFHRLFVFLMPGIGLGYEPGGNHTEVAWQLQNVNDPTNVHYSQQPVGAGGFALAPFHLSLEIGGMITQGFSLSLVGRFQVVTGANAETNCTTQPNGTCVKTGNETSRTTKATGAVAGFIRARYRFLTGKFHPYVHLDVGYGQIRHMLDVSGAQSDQYPLVDRYSAQQFNASANPDPAASTRQEVCSNHSDCRDSIAIGGVLVGGGAGIWYDFQKYMAFIFDVNVIGAVGPGDQRGMNVDLQLGIGAHFL